MFINIGAGDFYYPNWINVDNPSKFYNSQNLKVEWDIESITPLPFENDSVDLFYTSHVIEHVSDKSILNMFKECYDKLKSGGGIRITCPDIDILYNAYKNEKGLKYFFTIRDYQNKFQVSINEYYKLPLMIQKAKYISYQQLFLWSFARQRSIYHNMAIDPLTDDDVDELFDKYELEYALDMCTKKCDFVIQKHRPEEHINWWNINKVSSYLLNAGFKIIIPSHQHESVFPELRDNVHFDITKPISSLYVEAIK